MTQTRRRFLEDSLFAAAAVAGTPLWALAQDGLQAVADSDPIRIGVIGVRGRGRGHIGAFKKSPNAEVVAICDPDEAVIKPAMNAAEGATWHRDIRSMLERDDIDAVSIATPNHWHSLAAVWSLQAGKHVYVEKPISYDLHEGRVVYETAKRSGKIVQHGTQARSHKATRDAIAWLHSGALGRIKLARALCYKRRTSIGKVVTQTIPPDSIDFNLWTGPAAMQPLMRTNLHYDWHWDTNTGNGDIGNQGVHQMDIARWGLGKDSFPTHITSCGGRLGYDDDGNTPNTQIALYDYGDAQAIFEVRGLETSAYKNTHIGVIFHCEHGYLVSASYAKVVAFDLDGNQIKVFEGGGNHFQNFLDAVKQNDQNVLTATAWDGHVSSGMCHLGNISCHLGSPKTLAEDDAPFGTSDAGNESFERFKSHLVESGLDAALTQYQMGPTLTFDPQNEQFVGAHASDANPMLHRVHREEFAFDAPVRAKA